MINFKTERLYWKSETLVFNSAEVEETVVLVEKILCRGWTTFMEYWICRICLKAGEPLNLRDPDKAMQKKRSEFDAAGFDWAANVWSTLRRIAKPSLDRAYAASLQKNTKNCVKRKANALSVDAH